MVTFQQEVEYAKACALRVVLTAVEELETLFSEDSVQRDDKRYAARVSGTVIVLAQTLGTLIGTKVSTLENLHETVANATSMVMQAAQNRWNAREQQRQQPPMIELPDPPEPPRKA